MPLPPPSSRIFARYWQQYLRPHWAAMAGVLALMVIDGSVLGVVSALVEPLFDQVLLAGSDRALRAVAFGFLGLFLLRGLVSALARTLTAAITQRIAASTQSDMLAKIMALDIGFFQDHAPGVLLERVQGDTLAAQSVWTALLAGIGRDGLGLAALLWVAISVDPWWTLVTLCGFPLLVLPVIAVQGYMRRKAEQLREQAGLRATRLDEIFHGIQSVKLGRMEARQSARFALVLRTIRRAEVKLAASRATVPTLLDFATGVGFFSVLLVAGPDVAAGTRTPGEFMAFFTAIALVFQPLRRLGELSGVWQVAAVSVGRIYEILDMAPARARPTSPSPLLVPDPADDLVFDDVHFAHGAQEVLKGVSFTARAGQTTAIVGASGAGKTTVFHLLTGLLDPDAGTIRLGRLSLADLPLASQRALFATVSQEAAMFDETIAENILPGAGPQDAQRMAQAVKLAHVNEFLPRLPLGLDTAAGPRGSALSGGQRQRVAIARALVQEAPILLLDEATSALDGQSEAAVADALRGGAGRRTTIVIAHRLSTIRQADQIIVLEAGRVRESGSHDDLMARGGAYAGLHRLQGTP